MKDKKREFHVHVIRSKKDVLIWDAVNSLPGFTPILLLFFNYFFLDNVYAINIICLLLLPMSFFFAFYKYYTNAILRFQEGSIALVFNKKQNVVKWKDIIHFGLDHKESLLSEAGDFEIQTRDGTFHFSVTRYKFKSKRRMISDILNLVMEFPDAQKKTSEEIKEVINILQLKSRSKNASESKS